MSDAPRSRISERLRGVGRFVGRNTYVAALFVGFSTAGAFYVNWKYDQLSTLEATVWVCLAGIVVATCCGYRLYEIE